MDCLENEIMLAAVAARSGLHHLSCYHYASEYDNIIFSAIFSVNCFCGMILRETNLNFDTYNSLTPNWYYKVLR